MSRWLLGLLVALWTPVVFGHSLSASYLTIDASAERSQLAGRWEIALADLQTLIDLDTDADAAVTWGELRGQSGQIAAAALPGLDLRRSDRRCPASMAALLLNERSDGYYAVIEFVAPCAAGGGAIEISERLFFERDRTHRTLLAVQQDGLHTAAILTPDSPRWHAGTVPGGGLAAVRKFFAEGVWHIWIGYDHLAFLLLLLLPVVLRAEGRTWRSAASARPVLWAALRIVTAFTVAHSITLSLAASGLVTPPEKPVEMAIAASVAVAGVLNLIPAAARCAVAVAFGFGLIHGFGFASVLGELGLERRSLAFPLAGFNLGVETGQVAIVAVVLPLLYALRSSILYRRRLVPAISIGVGLLAIGWLIERAGWLHPVG